MAGVELVGFGSLLRAAQRGRVGGLGQVGLDPGGLKFLDHEPPPGAPLDGERGRLTVELRKPPAELDSRRRTGLAAVNLPGLGLHMVERDLLSVHVEPTYDQGGLVAARSASAVHKVVIWSVKPSTTVHTSKRPCGQRLAKVEDVRPRPKAE